MIFAPFTVVAVVMLAIAAVSYAVVVEYQRARAESHNVAEDMTIPLPPDFPDYNLRFIAIDREAIEVAYRQQVTNLFLVWMKDETGQPARATRGVHQAMRGYAHSMDMIKLREKMILEGGPPHPP